MDINFIVPRQDDKRSTDKLASFDLEPRVASITKTKEVQINNSSKGYKRWFEKQR